MYRKQHDAESDFADDAQDVEDFNRKKDKTKVVRVERSNEAQDWIMVQGQVLAPNEAIADLFGISASKWCGDLV